MSLIDVNAKLAKWLSADLFIRYWSPKWTVLSRFRHNAIFRTAYLWLLIVPITARLLQRIDSPLNLPVWGTQVPLNLDLPFSWKLLFFCAIFVSLANLIFSWKRPWFTTYKNFSEYRELGLTRANLNEFIMKASQRSDFYYRVRDRMVSRDPETLIFTGMFEVRTADPTHETVQVQTVPCSGPKIEKEMLAEFNKRQATHRKDCTSEKTNPLLLDEKNSTPEIQLADYTYIDDEKFADLFWMIHDIEDREKPAWRFICYILYILGTLGFLNILVENIYFVTIGEPLSLFAQIESILSSKM